MHRELVRIEAHRLVDLGFVRDVAIDGGKRGRVARAGSRLSRTGPGPSTITARAGIEAFRDKIRWEQFIKGILVLKRIVILRIGHRTTFKPAVQHLWDSLHCAIALFTAKGDRINDMLVKVIKQHATAFF